MQSKRPAANNNTPTRAAHPEMGHASGDALATVAFLGMVVATLCGAFTMGFPAIRAARENLHTSRILMDRAESLRLFTGSQVCDASSARKPLFLEPCDPRGLDTGARGGQYAAYGDATRRAPGDPLNAYRTHMRPVTLTVCWTNGGDSKPAPHTREVQARLARNGAPKYIWGAL